MGTDWREEARGIEPWDGAKLRWTGAPPLPPGVTTRYGTAYIHPNEAHLFVVDLSDPDTRAAFDRRLALRLGAPVEAVEEGVLFWLDGGESPRDGEWLWQVEAGGPARTRRPDHIIEEWPKWDGEALRLDTRDPLLARVRAWKSVPG